MLLHGFFLTMIIIGMWFLIKNASRIRKIKFILIGFLGGLASLLYIYALFINPQFNTLGFINLHASIALAGLFTLISILQTKQRF